MNYSRKHVKHIAYRFSFKDRVLDYSDWFEFWSKYFGHCLQEYRVKR